MKRVFFSLCLAFPVAACAQIPNAGFEQWDNSAGYDEPVGWTTFNPLGSLFNLSFAEKGTPGAVGNHFIRLTAQELSPGTPVLSLAVTGTADVGIDGFPWTTRSANLSGRFRFTPQENDEAHVLIAFYKWDPVSQSRIGLGGASLTISEATAAWSSFNVPIVFYDPQQPDTATISLISGGGEPTQPGTVFEVDDLSFQGVFTGVAEASAATITRVFPSPAQDRLWWTTYGAAPLQWRVLGLDGRVLLEGRDAGERAPLYVGELAPGAYLLQTLANGEMAVLRFVKG